VLNKSEIFGILIQSKNFLSVIRSDPNSVDLSKYLIQSGLYPKKTLWLSILLQWSMQFGYPYLIRLSFFQNPVQSGSGSEVQNPVGSRSGDRIMFNTGVYPWTIHIWNSSLRKKRRDSPAYSKCSAEIQSGPGALFKGSF